MSDRDSRIRDEAYRIWVEAGRPHGAEEQHWLEAERRLADDEDKTVVAGPKSKGMEAAAATEGPPGEAAPEPHAKAAAGAVAAPSGIAEPRPASPRKGASVEVSLTAKPRAKRRKPAG